MEELKCLRCGAEMEFSGKESFRLGEESYSGGILAKMTEQSRQMDVYTCPECGKIEFFSPVRKSSAPRTPKTNWTCSACGTYNLGRVQHCQGCGVTRQWSDQNRPD